MPAILEIINVISIVAGGLILGIVLNSRNTIGLVDAIGNLFVGTFNAASSTIR